MTTPDPSRPTPSPRPRSTIGPNGTTPSTPAAAAPTPSAPATQPVIDPTTVPNPVTPAPQPARRPAKVQKIRYADLTTPERRTAVARAFAEQPLMDNEAAPELVVVKKPINASRRPQPHRRYASIIILILGGLLVDAGLRGMFGDTNGVQKFFGALFAIAGFTLIVRALITFKRNWLISRRRPMRYLTKREIAAAERELNKPPTKDTESGKNAKKSSKKKGKKVKTS